jgi:hypothetical protein
MSSDEVVHLTLAFAAAVPALMIVGFWLDWRKQKHADRVERERLFEEQRRIGDERHHENTMWLTRLDTMIRPIVEWWNEAKHGGTNYR